MILFQQVRSARRACRPMIVNSRSESTAGPIRATSAPRVRFYGLRRRLRPPGLPRAGFAPINMNGFGAVSSFFDRGRFDNSPTRLPHRQLRAIGTAFDNAPCPSINWLQCICRPRPTQDQPDQAATFLRFCIAAGAAAALRASRLAQFAVFREYRACARRWRRRPSDETGFYRKSIPRSRPSWLRGRNGMTSRPLVSTTEFDPSASITSIDLSWTVPQGRAVKGEGFRDQRHPRGTDHDVAL